MTSCLFQQAHDANELELARSALKPRVQMFDMAQQSEQHAVEFKPREFAGRSHGARSRVGHPINVWDAHLVS